MFDPISIGIQLAIAAAVFVAQYALASRKKKETEERTPTVVRSASRPRSRSYGRVKRRDGLVYFFQARQADARMGVVFDHGPIDRYLAYFFGDKHAPVDSNNVIIGSKLAGWGGIEPATSATSDPGYTRVDNGHGFNGQVALDMIPGIFPDIFPAATHILKGIAHVQIGFTRPADPAVAQHVFPNGFPQDFAAEYYGARVWDPRDEDQNAGGIDVDGNWYHSTWLWSDNPALCILDYIRCPVEHGGWGKSLTRIDVPTFELAASVCGDHVSKGPGRGTEERYRLWGTYFFDESRAEVLGRMLATCDGEIYKTTDGKLALRLGAFGSPSVTFTRKEMSNVRLTHGAGKLSTVNQVIAKYTDREEDYQLIDAPVVRDAASIAALGGQVLSEELSLDYVPSSTQAFRLAVRWMRRQNPPRRLSFDTGPVGIKAMGETFVGINWPEKEIDNAVFQIIDHRAAADLTVNSFEMVEVTAATFDEPYPEVDPDYDPGDPTADSIPVPSSFFVAVGQESTGSSVSSYLEASCAAPTDTSLRLEAQYRRVGDPDWSNYGTTTNLYIVRSGVVSDDTNYQTRGRFIDPAGRTGDWTSTVVTLVTEPNFEAETDAVLARYVVEPSASRKLRLNKFINKLKNDGIWTKLDAIYLLASHAAADARLNLKGTSYTLTQTGTVTFNLDRGFTGDGSSGHHDTGFNPATAGGLFAQNSAHMGAWSLTNASNGGHDIGNTTSAFNARSAGGDFLTNGNAGGLSVAVADSLGHVMWSRGSSGGYDRYKNGTALAAATQASSALTSLPFWVGGRNHATTPTYSTRQIAAAHFGSHLTAGEVDNLRDALDTYLSAAGAI